MKQNPIKREAIEHLYAYSAIKGALMSGEDEAAEREEIESAAFGFAANFLTATCYNGYRTKQRGAVSGPR